MSLARTHSETPTRRMTVVIDDFRFPGPSASASRVLHFGKALVSEGFEVLVLNARPGFAPPEARSGVVDGVVFDSCYPGSRRAPCFLVRRWQAVSANARVVRAIRRWSAAADRAWVHLYTDRVVLSTLGILAARSVCASLTAELGEWRPVLPSATHITSLYYRFLRFKQVDGVIAISDYLARRANQFGAHTTMRLPIMGDLSKLELPTDRPNGDLVWCGSVDAYLESIMWIIDALSHVDLKRHQWRLVVTGPSSELSRKRLAQQLSEQGLEMSRLHLAGLLPRPEFEGLLASATALLVPLEADERSIARFPTKIIDYIRAGRPMIAAGVGDLNGYLRDMENSVVYQPGDKDSFRAACLKLLGDPALGQRLADEASRSLAPCFDYRALAPALAAFLRRL